MPVTNVNVTTDRASKNKTTAKLQLFIRHKMVHQPIHVTGTSIQISHFRCQVLCSEFCL